MSAARWKDICPWISAPGTSPGLSAIAEEEVPSELSGDASVETVFSHIEDHLDLVPLTEVFPCVDREGSVESLALRPRSANVLRRNALLTLPDILDNDLRTLCDMRGAGPQLRRDLIEGLVFASMFANMLSGSWPAHDSKLGVVAEPPSSSREESLSEPRGDIVQDLQTLANWNVLVGQPTRPLLSQDHVYPESEAQAAQRVLGITAETLSLPLGPTLAELLHERFSRILNARNLDILRHRILSNNPETLDELGRRHGVTRERIRQVEMSLMKELEGIAAEDPFPSIFQLISGTIGRLARFDFLREEVAALEDQVEGWDVPVWQLLSLLSQDFELGPVWCAAPSLEAHIEATGRELVEKADAYGAVRLGDLDLGICGAEEDRAELTQKWVERLGEKTFAGHALLQTSSIQDYAAGILSVCKRALSSEEILEQFDRPRSVRSLRNQLAEDQRFRRVDRDAWALTEWGLEEYLPIKTMLLRQVEEAGGAISLREVTAQLTSQFSVSPSSVTTYANVPPLGVRDGMVVLVEESPEVRVTVERSARFYRRGKSWLYRVSVTNDHVRGSGTMAPMALVPLLHLQHGIPQHLPSVLGDQAVYWTGAQPTFGTLRRFIENLNADEGDQIFLLFRDDGSFGVERVPQLTGNPIADALALVGAPAELPSGVAERALGMAIGASYSSDLQELAQCYADRGDQDVAELLWREIWG